MTGSPDDRRGIALSYLPYAVIAFFGIMLTIRGLYGFCQSDECFYISTAGRFAAGDRIFIDEWHPTQLSSLITAPVYIIYSLFSPDRNGIILFFRVLYVVLSTIEAVFIYKRISDKHTRAVSLSLSMFLMLYCHLNMATLSYYMLTFHFFILGFLLIYTGKSDYSYLTAGISIALAVLSLPSLAVAYVCVMFFILIACFFKKEFRRPVLFVTTGIIIPLVIFVIYVYASGVGIAGILANLVNILSDSEHDRGYVQSFFMFFNAIRDSFDKIYYFSILLVIISLPALLNEKYRMMIKNYVLIADIVLFAYYAILASDHTGFINTAFALFVFPLFFLTEKKNWFIFISLFMGGLVVTATYCFSSYSDLYVLSIGHGIAAAGGILILDDFIRESILIIKYVSYLVIAVTLIITGLLRFTYIYRDSQMVNLKAQIKDGPAAGLYTTEEHMRQYMEVLETVRKYDGEGYVLFSRILPWGYIVTDMRAGAPDTWRNSISSERLQDYYDKNPSKYPDIVFVADAEIGSYETAGDVEADPAPNANEFTGTFAEMLKTEYTEHIERGCTVYTRK
ncbi:MAG: glucosyltransferase domain-containing protein [Lachnospiraceae bacterium]|nr:glucosyltransferase domain-containing protein [Lachnospiraceae bacterium]